MMMTKRCAPRDLMMLWIVTLAVLMSRKRAVMCQGHFKPIVHPRQQHLSGRNVYTPHGAGVRQQVAYHPTPIMPNKGLMASLGGRGHSYLNQMIQQHQMRVQQQQGNVAPMSDRRASALASMGAAANQLFPSLATTASHRARSSDKLNTQEVNGQQHPQQQQQQVGSADQGKLLICYYTTKQTAPYWPKDGREFVVPADRLNQVVSSLSQQQQQQQGKKSLSTTTTAAAAAAAANRFSAREPDGGQRHGAPSNHPLSLDAANVRQNQEAHMIKHHNQPQVNSFAGGRMIVVAPKFVPFNRTTNGNIQNRVISEPAMVSSSQEQAGPELLSPFSFAQMFSMANNEQHQSHSIITNRQDNAASFTTTTSATNQPSAPGQSMAGLVVVPQMVDLIVANHDNIGGSGGGIIFDKIPRGDKQQQQHDLNSERNNIDTGGPPPPLTIVNQESHTKTNLPQPQAMLVRNQNNGQQRPTANANNFHQLERGAQMKDQQQQLIYSPSSSQPSMSRTIIVGASVATPLVASQATTDSGQNQMLAQTVPLMNGDNSDYYYYYNQPSSSSPIGAAGGSSVSGPTAATTFSLPTSPYRTIQQQQQKAKSLQVAESEISPALPTSSLPPFTFVEFPSGSPPSYSISGIPGHQSQTLDRLIVSNGPSSTSVRHTHQQQQQYINPAVSASSSQTTSSASAGDLLKSSSSSSVATGDDGSISSGTKTTPIASVASPSSSSSSSPSVTSQLQHQLVATLPSSLLISYPPPPPPPTSIALAQQPPNGSSTAAAAASTSAQVSAGKSVFITNLDANTAAAAAAAAAATNGNNRNHHQHNNRQFVGVGGNSLSATLVSSPLSTMFDVFGAASQYLMRFKPSSLISPSSFASLGIVGDASGHHHNFRSNSSSSPLVSLPFASSILGGSSGLHRKSNTSDSGFLSRLTLQTQQRREDICGRTIQTPERRIIGGEGAKYGEFPYQVHIKIAKHQCGGALIDKQSIVTAAHCVYHFITRAPVSKLQIVIGAYDIEDEQYQELPPQYFKVNRVKLHPNFRFSASHPDRYDIAILKLDKPVKYTDNVLPVCLPGGDLKYENMVGTVTGFGKTDPSLSNRYGTRLLQKVDVPIIENGECERWHRTRGIDLKIFPEMMCAGYEDGLKDACVGDSGGPLVVKTPVGSNGSFRWTLAGITSAGFGCAQSRQPGIYHRVSHTVDWILDNLD